MSTPTPRDLTKWDILHLLEETDSELPPGEPIDLTVGGGSAVIFWWETEAQQMLMSFPP